MNIFKKFFALRKAKKEEKADIPTLRELKKEDKEFKKASDELAHMFKRSK